MPNWMRPEETTLADTRGYYMLGFNSQWSAPKVRVGFYDAMDADHRFRLIGGPHMELAPSHVARLPDEPA